MLRPETGNELASFNRIRLIIKYLIESRSLLFLFLTEVPTAFLSFFVNENIKIPEYHYVSKVARNCNAIGLIKYHKLCKRVYHDHITVFVSVPLQFACDCISQSLQNERIMTSS